MTCVVSNYEKKNKIRMVQDTLAFFVYIPIDMIK